MAIYKKNLVKKAHISAVGPVKVLASHGIGMLKQALSSKALKTARMHGEIDRRADGEVDLAAEISKHPEALWMRVKAIEADNENDNGDYFSREEILKAYKTFEGCPVFTNHENQKVENAKGKVVLAEWDDAENAVYCTMFIDREANPALCRAIEEGYVTDVSMGTQVDFSVCSACGNRAHTADQYCDHVKTMKGRVADGTKVYEENYGLKFIEISVVTDGACKDCTIREILDPQEVLAATHELAVAAQSYKNVRLADMTKNGGQQEIELLNSAMDNIEKVLRAMLDQRRFIDLEFMQNLTEVFAELQHVTDELVDQGYGSVSAQPAAPGIPEMPETGKEQGPAVANQPTTSPGGMGVGNITSPASSEGGRVVSAKDQLRSKLEDLRHKAQKIYDEINSGEKPVSKAEKFQNTISKLAAVWENPSVKNFKTEVSEGDFRIVVGKEEILGMRGAEKLASLRVADLDPDIQEALKEDAYKTAGHMLDSFKGKYASFQKVAESATSDTEKQWEETMEAQLRREKLELHPRENDVRQSITEDQLREKGTHGYDTSPHKQGMEDGGRHEITEKQLGHGSSSKNYEGFDHHKPQFDPRDEIMELQLRNTSWNWNITPGTSDISWAAGVDDQKQQITEGQLQDWLSADDGHNPLHHITEKQLRDDQDDPLGRRVAGMIAKEVLARAKEIIRRTAIMSGAAPDEIIELISANSGSKNDEILSKYREEKQASTRKTLLKRAKFNGANLTGEALTEAFAGNVADQKLSWQVAMNALEAIAEQENAEEAIAEIIKTEPECKNCDVRVASPKDLLKEALLDKGASEEAEPVVEDVEVVITSPDEIEADPNDKEAYAKAAFEVAKKYAAAQGVEVTENVHVKKAKDGVHVAMKGVRKEAGKGCDCGHENCPEGCPDDCACKKQASSDKETKEADLKARSEARRKEAQFGGEGFGAPGAGAPASPTGDVGGGGGTTMPMGGPMADPSAGPGVGALGEPEGGTADAEDDNPESLPPGSICPSCGSDDVDVKNGAFDCNNCGAAGNIEVNMKVTNWPDTIQEKGPGGMEGEDLDLDAGIGDMEGGEGIEMPQVGVASIFRITDQMVKIAKQKPLGSYCPHCGSGETKLQKRHSGSIKGSCKACGNNYLAEAFLDTDTNDLVGRVAWVDKNVEKLAKEQREARKAKIAEAKTKAKKMASRREALQVALKAKGLTKKFASASLVSQAAIIGQLAEEGLIPKE